MIMLYSAAVREVLIGTENAAGLAFRSVNILRYFKEPEDPEHLQTRIVCHGLAFVTHHVADTSHLRWIK